MFIEGLLLGRPAQFYGPPDNIHGLLLFFDPDSGDFVPLNSGVSSLLVLTPTPWDFVDDSGADNGQPVNFVTLASGDVIAVEGM